MLGNFFVVCSFFSKSSFSKNSFRNMIRESNSLNPGQARQDVRPDLGPNCLQMLSADDTTRQRVNRGAPQLSVSQKEWTSSPESHQAYHYSFSSVLTVLVPS